MRRITLWITATLAVTALLFAYQANLAGAGGKSGDSRNSSSTPTAGTASAPAKAGDTAPGDGTRTGKPGENK
jgi:hypothetical protein